MTFAQPTSCTQSSCGFYEPLPSPDGRRILYRSDDGMRDVLILARGNGGSPKRIFPLASEPNQRLGEIAWAPNSRKFAYVAACCGSAHPLHVARADGFGDHVVTEQAGYGPIAWSPDSRSVTTTANLARVPSPRGRWIAQEVLGYPFFGIRVESPGGQVKRVIQDAFDPLWSPDARVLAYRTKRTELNVMWIGSGRSKLLVHDLREDRITWSPDSLRLAYISASGDLRTVTLEGRSGTLLGAGAKNLGNISWLAWTRAPRGIRYRRPAKPKGLYAGSFVTRLAGDGARVAYATCGQVAVWTPPAPRAIDGAFASCPGSPLRPTIYDVAIAGGRVAYTGLAGGNTTLWWLNGFTFDLALQPFGLDSGTNTCCLPIPQVAGAGELLVFGTRRVEYMPNPMALWELRRVGPAGCPCPLLQTYHEPIRGPLTLDVDEGQILIARTDSVELFKSDGSRLMMITGLPAEPQPFTRALEAILSGQDLYIRTGTTLRDYDVDTAALRRTWPLPAVPPSPTAEMLQDAGHGLVVDVRGSEIHVLRVADGSDRVAARGSVARFIDKGLVYAEGSRLHLVGWSALSR